MSETAVRLLLKRFQAAEAVRVTREGLWKQLQDVVRPESLDYVELQNTADARRRRLLDSSGAEALELFASFLTHEVFMVGSTDAVFQYVPTSGAGVRLPTTQLPMDAQAWLKESALAVTSAMFSGRHSAVSALHSFCLDLGLYGSACLGVWKARNPRRPEVLRFRHYPVWSVAAEMADGVASVIYVKEKMSRRAAQMRWPDASFDGVDDENPEAIEAVFVCISAEDPDIEAAVSSRTRALNTPWFGVWLLRRPRQMVLEERGYTECPMIFAPWYLVDSGPWGRSPAMTALGDVFMLQNLSDVTMRGIEKLVSPPMLVRDGALMSPLRVMPDGITNVDTVDAVSPLLPAGASRVDLGVELMRDRQARIERAFFLPLFMGQTGPGKQPRTAYEVSLHKRERDQAVAPMVLRLMNNVLEPLVERVLSILLETGVVPPVPESLRGARLRVQSSSPLVTTLQEGRAAGLERWVLAVSQMAQALGNLEITDAVNTDVAARLLHEATNAPADVLRSPQEVEDIRSRRREQQQAVAQAEATAQNASAAADLMTAASKAGMV